MFKFILFLSLTLFSITSFGVECNKEQESGVLKNKVFSIPNDCTIKNGVTNALKYQHALAYGHTDIAEKLIGSSFWVGVLDIDTTYKKIHLYNLHGRYFKTLDTLKKINPSATDKSYILASSETNLKMGNIPQADILFQKIENRDYEELPSAEYMLVHLELIFHKMDYELLYKQSEKYFSSIKNSKGTGVIGHDHLVLAWLFVGAHMSGNNREDKIHDIKFTSDLITSIYSKNSVFYKEHKRILGMLNKT